VLIASTAFAHATNVFFPLLEFHLILWQGTTAALSMEDRTWDIVPMGSGIQQ